jgi:hypothetical protein
MNNIKCKNCITFYLKGAPKNLCWDCLGIDLKEDFFASIEFSP